MRSRFLSGAIVASCIWAAAGPLAAQAGRIEGQVVRPDGVPLPAVEVRVAGTTHATLTDSRGRFALSPPPGEHTLVFQIGGRSETLPAVQVPVTGSVRVDHTLDWDLAVAETITVFSASRHPQRITEAPAAVTVVGEEEIQREAAHGQLPKVLEFTPGAEVTQSGLYDFNLNTRGFNSTLNRRLAVVVDGRDPSVPFLAAQEWAAFSLPLDDIARVELVRGPSAALYGANAASGVLNVLTLLPRDSRGGLARLTGGELSTANLDLRWAGTLQDPWYFKLLGGFRSSGDFTVSRVGQAEYAVPCVAPGQTECLPQEAVPPDPLGDNQIAFGSARVDRHFRDGSIMTWETAAGNIEGPVFQTAIGRVQVVDAERRWTRLDYSREHWNVLAAYNRRQGDRQTALATGDNLVLDEKSWRGEIQTNWPLFGDRGHLVAGISWKDERVDSEDPQGPLRSSLLNPLSRQTLLFEPVHTDAQAIYAQTEWSLTPQLSLVVAARWDSSTLHDSQLSPKAALVWSPSAGHALRLTYNEAFQSPSYNELFLQADLGPPIDLTPLEAICFRHGVACGFDIDFIPGAIDTRPATRILAVGNPDLEVEEIRTVEVGYSGILGRRLFVTADYYRSRNENFITDLLPLVGTPLGRFNAAYLPWQPPDALPPEVQAQLLATLQGLFGPLFAFFAHNVDGTDFCWPIPQGGCFTHRGTPILAMASYANFGSVDTQGVDLGAQWYFADRWSLGLSASWFDFSIREAQPGLEGLLLPNTPELKANAALGYAGDRWDATVAWRWVDEFPWAVGPFQGTVPSYSVVDLGGNVHLGEHWTVGFHVANLLDENHWETFGGDRLGRRALGHISLRW